MLCYLWKNIGKLGYSVQWSIHFFFWKPFTAHFYRWKRLLVTSHFLQIFSYYLHTVNNYSPLKALYRHMLCVFFHRHSSDKIYSALLYHLLNFTLHSKANACNIDTFIRFYMQMRVEKNTKHLPIDSIGHSHNSVSSYCLIYILW